MKEPKLLRNTLAVSFLLTAALFLLPLFFVDPLRPTLFSGDTPADESEDPVESPQPPSSAGSSITLQVLHNGLVAEMDLEAYLVGVLRAEMPATFEPEALKAQAVAARTYTLYKIRFGGNHSDTADICTDPGCCQAWKSTADAQAGWGSQADAYEEKMLTAVEETCGQVMFYAGEPILAAFHASSSGLTRPSDQVWQSDLPYLQAVASPEDGSSIPNYYSQAEFTAEAFRGAVAAVCPNADLSGPMSGWLTNAVTDSSGNVSTLSVGGVTLKGTQLRSALGLRSACFTWSVEESKLVFHVTGYGHGVGMSQYGANAMAAAGATWQDILTHYYTGVTIRAYAE